MLESWLSARNFSLSKLRHSPGYLSSCSTIVWCGIVASNGSPMCSTEACSSSLVLGPALPASGSGSARKEAHLIAEKCCADDLSRPIQSYWVFPPIEGSKCLNEGTATLIIGIFNCVADLLTTILPIPLIMRLQMPLKHRMGVCVLLGLGFIVTIAGAIRTCKFSVLLSSILSPANVS